MARISDPVDREWARNIAEQIMHWGVPRCAAYRRAVKAVRDYTRDRQEGRARTAKALASLEADNFLRRAIEERRRLDRRMENTRAWFDSIERQKRKAQHRQRDAFSFYAPRLMAFSRHQAYWEGRVPEDMARRQAEWEIAGIISALPLRGRTDLFVSLLNLSRATVSKFFHGALLIAGEVSPVGGYLKSKHITRITIDYVLGDANADPGNDDREVHRTAEQGGPDQVEAC
jgi:hypothetical protein